MLNNNTSISFIIPTYNADKYLESCLSGIKNLNQSDFSTEIIVSDGGSSDGTKKILKGHHIKIIDNPRIIAEYGKYEAFKVSKGEFVVFLDADNVITDEDWLSKLLKPFENDEVIGVESNYLLAKDFTSLNKYANLLVIVDPLARILSSRASGIVDKKDYVIKSFKKDSLPVSGANGFIWRRSILEPFAQNSNALEETTILQTLASQGEVKIGNVPGVGIYHYYCSTLWDYLQKRKKIANKFLDRRKKKTTWVDRRMGVFKILSGLYLISVMGPFVEAMYQMGKTKQRAWLWHPLVSFLTMITYGFYLIRSKLDTIKS